MQEILNNIYSSPFFGLSLTIGSYILGVFINKKLKTPLANPVLIASAVVIAVVVLLDVPLDAYSKGGDLVSMFLAPATACLAVGPAVQGELTDKHCEMLKSCYSSCLEIAVENHIGSIAFCCISTGVFGFPKQEAAEIAVKTVRDFLKNNSIKVIFNVFGDDDHEIYKRLLGRN